MLALVLLGTIAVTERLVRPWSVEGPSMEPTLLAGDRVLVDLWTLRHRAPRSGEIVLFEGPQTLPAPLVKRVVAAPPFPDDRPRSVEWPGVRLDRPGIFVVGDHRQASVDSRRFGPVPREKLVGRVVFRYWPVARWGPVH